MPKTRRPYPAEFRAEMVRLVRAGRTPGGLSREFEPSDQTIRNWVNQADIDEGRREGLTTAEREELRRLRRENRILREEKEILGKSSGLVRRGDRIDPQAAFGFVKANQASHSVRRMCSLLGVSPSGYYAWLGRSPSAREVADRALRDRIVDIHSRSRGTYGAPRVHAELSFEGVCVGRKRVARLMRQASIQGVHRRRKVTTTRRNPERAAAPDLVKREFTADGPDRTWVADITYVPTKAGFLYLAVVLDLWSRKVVGWSMRDDLSTPLVTDALDMAIEQRKPDGVIHHSDRGSQYTSGAFGVRCEQAGIEVSMGRRGDAYDNAVAESFFATLETELLDRASFANRNQARSAVFDYIEGFYNPHRRHSTIGYHSPADYERIPQLPCG
ncbi:MAG: IS3 family transposase [bacterium]|nr:IS3 family transposase [bacterium]